MPGAHPSSARPVAGQSALRPCPRTCGQGAEPSRTSDRVWLHPHRDLSRPGRALRGRVGAHAGRTARSQPTRQNGGAAQLKIHFPCPPQGHALAQRHARAGRPAQRSPGATPDGTSRSAPPPRATRWTARSSALPWESGMPAAVMYKGRGERPRRTGTAWVAVRHRFGHPITRTANSAYACAPRPGRPTGPRSA